MVRTVGEKNAEAGSAQIEFAFVAIVLLLLLFGIIGLARAAYSYVWVCNAARTGTRYAMVRGACPTNVNLNNPCPVCSSSPLPCSAYLSDIESYIQTNATLIDWPNVTVDAKCFASDTVAGIPPCAPGTWVWVSVKYEFAFVTPLLPQATWQMSSTSERITQY